MAEEMERKEKVKLGENESKVETEVKDNLGNERKEKHEVKTD